MVRGKKRIGYEIKIKIKFEGQKKFKGVVVWYRFKEFCDDGSVDAKFKITKETKMQAGVMLKKEMKLQNTSN